MISKERKSKFFYSGVALIFSIILFFNANGRNLQSTLANTPEDYEKTVQKVPIQAVYDSDEYYIHGFQPNVNVQLSSANRIQLNAEANEETRNFSVVADLTKLKEGTHEVTLRTQNLSSAVTASIEPKTIAVTIEKKVTQKFKVDPVVSSSNLDEGYKINKFTVTPEEVNITTGEDTLDVIDRVVATVDPAKVASQNFEESVTVQALDHDGNTLSVVSDPQKVTVAVSVTAPEKDVGLYALQQGQVPNGISHYTFAMAHQTGKLSGPLDLISDITSVAVPVDITNITEKTVRTLEIPVDRRLSISPTTVSIEITPVAVTKDSDPAEVNQQSGNSNNGNANQNNNNQNSGNSTEESETEQSQETVDSSEADKTETSSTQE